MARNIVLMLSLNMKPSGIILSISMQQKKMPAFLVLYVSGLLLQEGKITYA